MGKKIDIKDAPAKELEMKKTPTKMQEGEAPENMEKGQLNIMCERCHTSTMLDPSVSGGLNFVFPITMDNKLKLTCPKCDNVLYLYYSEVKPATEEDKAKAGKERKIVHADDLPKEEAKVDKEATREQPKELVGDGEPQKESKE